jgi:hypothetical protein
LGIKPFKNTGNLPKPLSINIRDNAGIPEIMPPDYKT